MIFSHRRNLIIQESNFPKASDTKTNGQDFENSNHHYQIYLSFSNLTKNP